MEISFNWAVRILGIFDIAKADEFYQGFLGFSVDWDRRPIAICGGDSKPHLCGTLETGVMDPFGNLICFCERVEEAGRAPAL
jgi:Glyoxalase superfamily protein